MCSIVINQGCERTVREISSEKSLRQRNRTLQFINLAGPGFHAVLEDLSPAVRWLTGTNLSIENREPWDRLTPSSIFHVDEPSLVSRHSSIRSVGSIEMDCLSNITPSASLTPINTAYSIDAPQNWTSRFSDSQVSMNPHSRKPSSQSILQPEYAGARSCYALAHSTLESLQCQFYLSATSVTRKEHFSTSPPPNSPSSSIRMATLVTPTLGHVLRNNKAAISNIRQLLACSCAFDPHLAMLYTSLVFKILIWYRVVRGRKKSIVWGSDSSVAGASRPSDSNTSVTHNIALLTTTTGELTSMRRTRKPQGCNFFYETSTR